VKSATVIRHKFTWQSWGVGFVEMSTPRESKQAIAALREAHLGGRDLTVNEARPKEEGYCGCFE
jgi:cold-inducible RNA-binding protein